MNKETIEFIDRTLLADGDYVSVGLEIIKPDKCFPNMIVEDINTSDLHSLKREIPHNLYVDKRETDVGFLSRDEAHILYNTAHKFRDKKALAIGCWYGWSVCHLALAGVKLDVIDALLVRKDIHESVTNSLRCAGVLDSVNLVSSNIPQIIEELAEQLQRKWSLIFIDGTNEAINPLNYAIICEQLAETEAFILFNNLNSLDVTQGLDYLKQKGWNTMIYQTRQIMGVAWRGNIEPVQHQPDPNVNWSVPEHLQNYHVSELSSDSVNEFMEIITAIRPYTLLGEIRLFSLYSLAKKICIEDIPGNFVECGSYKGGAAALLASVIKRYSLRPRLLYACDTFEGMPEPTEIDIYNGIPANETGFGVGTLKAPIGENIQAICQLLKVQDIVVPVKGLFANTLPQYKSEIGNIAFMHADGDWYESTMDIFNTLYDSVVINGMIQVDDYGHWDGCQKALHDFEHLKGEKFNLHRIDYTAVWFKKG
ncbi:class I SAM-dependent methyltransferase [Nostoc sp. LEGE 12447]|uniref:TylF/MycF/NovP-related O-methyltransferase n=1 Tax=Nostoc sp. LEGE 12447 TaxID=1828640 RepID=UPI0018829215|nr:TylF/MycF/NovP-related O-methyltransferase [Nostoc sp. LEGE 12447]MBE8996982.1 class I SAM-dependent methyltransferase [Nostoc sp. LEGE 12447]